MASGDKSPKKPTDDETTGDDVVDEVQDDIGKQVDSTSKKAAKASKTPELSKTERQLQKAAKAKEEKQRRSALGNRWAAPAMIASAVLGLAWIVVYYTTINVVTIPVYTNLGEWNLAIGMGFIMLAFVFATKWR